MSNRTISRILVAGVFLVSVMIVSNAAAQTMSHPSKGPNAVESNPACQRILNECKKLGFISGQYKKDNGLWRDCFTPVVKGQGPTREGKPISVPVSASDVQECRAVAEHHK